MLNPGHVSGGVPELQAGTLGGSARVFRFPRWAPFSSSGPCPSPCAVNSHSTSAIGKPFPPAVSFTRLFSGTLFFFWFLGSYYIAMTPQRCMLPRGYSAAQFKWALQRKPCPEVKRRLLKDRRRFEECVLSNLCTVSPSFINISNVKYVWTTKSADVARSLSCTSKSVIWEHAPHGEQSCCLWSNVGH